MEIIQYDKWNSLDEFFTCLNEKACYVILRNFENLDSDVLLLKHPDIDILCSDRAFLLSISRSFPRGNNNDYIHRFIFVKNKKIDVDIRCIGDGYYDTYWEKNILLDRVFYNGKFYIPSKQNYFYSLLYHVLIQKNEISNDYVQKLGELARDLNILNNTFLNIPTLQSFMREKKYKFTYPESPYTIANFKNVDKSLIKKEFRKIFERKFVNIRSLITKKIKGLLLWEKK